ncbi:protein NRT1/ PTR FAMILY 5.7-like [Quillaja saponaria]|uniref:Protein NRT1/ PTR FAMILY 5.7-like n=1 Tax=Quillaja saponaria TaxID=32244 RepID=A0AAD7LPS9_QUISA|nr:protein NRT1/ PTR FAMILY 5.7-like [Quillaja saponaria]
MTMNIISFVRRIRGRIIFSRAILFSCGLIVTHSLLDSAVVAFLINYLTDTKGKQLNLRNATIIVNLQDGLSSVFAVTVTHLSMAYTGRFNMIVFCTSAYIIGLTLLWVTAWSSTEFSVYYVAVILIAFGKVGGDPLLRNFLRYQLEQKIRKQSTGTDREKEKGDDKYFKDIWFNIAWIVGGVIAITIKFDKYSWLKTFEVSALLMGGTYLFFYSGFMYYSYDTPIGSPLSIIYRVFKGAVWNLTSKYPNSTEKYYWNNYVQQHCRYKAKTGCFQLLPRVRFFNWLDKASVMRETPDLTFISERQERKKKLCSVKKVREVKRILTLTPFLLTFCAYSLVAASGNTYFIEQASNLNPHIGSNNYEISSSILFVLQSFTSIVIAGIFSFMELTKQSINIFRYGGAMVCSVVCCIAAWLVERYRLSLIKEEGALENPDKTISLSILVLTPQYFLLGLMEGLAEEGIENFFNNHVPKSMKKFDESFGQIVLATGKFLCVPLVLIFGNWIKKSCKHFSFR